MSSIPRRSSLRLTAAIAILCALAAVVLGFAGSASAKSSNHGTTANAAASVSATTKAPALTGLELLLRGLIRTLNTSVAGLGATVDNTGTLVNNTTTALTTTVKQTTNNLTTVLTGLLSGGSSHPTTPPPSTPASNPPSTPVTHPSTPAVSTPTNQTGASVGGLSAAPSNPPRLVGSTSSIAPSSPPTHPRTDTESTAQRLLHSVSVLALVGMTGALAFGVGAIVLGAGRRGQRAA